MLLAWLTNNYWMTNFQADQGGELRFRFWLLPGARRLLGAAAQDALTYTRPLAAHLYAGCGEVRQSSGTLLETELGALILTRLERTNEGGVALTLLNPENIAANATIRSARVRLGRAWRTSLSGERQGEVAFANGEIRLPVGARAWTALEIEPG